MRPDRNTFLANVNLTRYQSQAQGHYESFFQRANHPTRPLAFWIRYTLFSPQAHPELAVGELWAIFFNGETNQHLALKQEYPLGQCAFSASEFRVQIGDARLDSGRLQGAVQTHDRVLSWELSYGGDSDPLLLLPLNLYQTKFPAAKSLVGLPLARYQGKLSVNGETVEVADWLGSQNHNWGTRHTDRYAWGQVAGFDAHPDSFLEVATASVRLGPVWTPPLTLIVLRHNGQDYALNGVLRALGAHGAFDYFNWRFKSNTPQVELAGAITAPANAFVGLTYANPPGGAKYCLNTKIASCRLQITDRARGVSETLETNHRAAFEIFNGRSASRHPDIGVKMAHAAHGATGPNAFVPGLARRSNVG